MDWIEQWLHVSPDGGNGSTEALYAALAIAAALTVVGVIARRRTRGRRNGGASDGAG